MTTAYDGGTSGLQNLPADAATAIVVVGSAAEAAKLRAKYPHATFLLLDHSGIHYDYDILDFEKLFVNIPAVARKWALARQAAGKVGVIYANPVNYLRLEKALGSIPWNWWVANQTGTPHNYVPKPGQKKPCATQWFGSQQKTWQHYDISEVADVTAFKGGGTGGRGKVAVPDVTGTEWAAAAAAIAAAGLVAAAGGTITGTVSSEAPAAGTQVTSGSTVTLMLSGGGGGQGGGGGGGGGGPHPPTPPRSTGLFLPPVPQVPPAVVGVPSPAPAAASGSNLPKLVIAGAAIGLVMLGHKHAGKR